MAVPTAIATTDDINVRVGVSKPTTNSATIVTIGVNAYRKIENKALFKFLGLLTIIQRIQC